VAAFSSPPRLKWPEDDPGNVSTSRYRRHALPSALKNNHPPRPELVTEHEILANMTASGGRIDR
jgi:hypothetical protein